MEGSPEVTPYLTLRRHLNTTKHSSGEGTGTPLQCPCLENPRDGGAWQAAVYGVAESNTTDVT